MFKFGIFQLDEEAIRLIKYNKSISIEPQVFNTLLFLIKNRHRVVTKEDLFNEIWHGRPVSDHVITRIIYELRKILDDKNGQNSKIRTVRGKGYQFIVEVVESQKIDTLAGVQLEPVSILGQTPSMSLQYKLISVIALIMLAIVIFVLINLYGEQSSSSKNISPLANQNTYPIVAVLPIDVESDNEELSMLVQSLIEYLTNQLAVNLNMKVIHPDNLMHLGDQLDDIWTIQETTHSDYIIQGFVESVTDQSINLHLTLYKNNGTGEIIQFPLGAFQFPYPQNAKDLNDLYKQRKVTIRSIIQIIKPGVIIRDNGATETDDSEAYRLVIAAHHMSRNDDCEDLKRAEKLLLNATERDDEFAYAYYQLFANYFKRVWLCGESIEYHQKALVMAEIVQRLAPDSYNPMAIGVNAILIESNQVEKAYELSKNVQRNDPIAINFRNYSLRYAGFLHLASQHLDRILQLDPFFFSAKPIHQAPNTLLYQNRFSEYISLLAEPGNSYHDYFRGLSLLLSDNTLEASKILQSVIERNSTGLFDKLSQALFFIIEHDNSAAIEIIDALVQQRQIKKHTDGEMTYKMAQLYALAGAKELAIKHLRISVDRGFFPMNYFLIDPALKSIQNTKEFSRIVGQAAKRHRAFADRFGLEPEVVLQ